MVSAPVAQAVPSWQPVPELQGRTRFGTPVGTSCCILLLVNDSSGLACIFYYPTVDMG